MRTTRSLEALRRLDVGLTLVLLAALALRLSWLAFVIRGGAIENGAVDGVAIAELLLKGSGIDAAPADVAAKCTNEFQHPSRPRLAPEPPGHLRAPIADVPAPPAADRIGESPHLASRLRVTPGRTFPCPAASG